eukprot:CAMPEP_0180343416 /NCGR_PEP_ID=MMETSP0989-20121125/2274_1 /TAXON_ID=697907 /ORGANISM="non described non described, Strain CCMP2293" /LENGTH=229 /DNA_ID=CAMNT_0022332371 /DNA_START=15 /DNA_END=704 /DNA_ORIENTATION=+
MAQATLHRMQIGILSAEPRRERLIGTNSTQHFISYGILCHLEAHGSHPVLRWTSWHRYKHFHELWRSLLKSDGLTMNAVRFPPKRFLRGAARAVVEERKQDLSAYLIEACKGVESQEGLDLLFKFLEVSQHQHPPAVRRQPPQKTEKGQRKGQKRNGNPLTNPYAVMPHELTHQQDLQYGATPPVFDTGFIHLAKAKGFKLAEFATSAESGEESSIDGKTGGGRRQSMD